MQNGVPNRFTFLYVFVLLCIVMETIHNKYNSVFNVGAFAIALILPLVIYVFVDFNLSVDCSDWKQNKVD